jgi:FMN phosphatase YigB (HAD superfamily)
MPATVADRLSTTTTSAIARSLAEYRAWLVDLDGTLYRARGVRLAMAMELAVSGWRDVRIVQAFRREHERMRGGIANRDPIVGDDRENPCAKRAIVSFLPSCGVGDDRENPCAKRVSAFEQQICRTAERLELPLPSVQAVVERWMVERPGKWIRLFRRRSLLASIATHRSGGGRAALVSDYPARRKLASLAASELFEVVIANGEGGTTYALKPHPGAYIAAAEQLATPPGDCVVIGDRFDADGLAARSAGMAFCHVKDMIVMPPA